MRKLPGRFLASILICGLALWPWSTRAEQPAAQAITSIIERTLVDWPTPGIAIGVIQEGRVIYEKGFGLREAGSTSRVDADTLFQIGSLTKAFSATALGILVDRGQVGWDDAVVEHLDGFRLADPWLTNRITVRDLVAHRTGVEESFMFFGPMEPKDVVRRARLVGASAAFRQEFLYSNMMSGFFVTRLIEAVTGASWSSFQREEILDPIGMSSSGGSPYEYWDRKLVAPSYFGRAPSGGVHADMANVRNIAMPHVWTATGWQVLPWRSYDISAAAGSNVSNLKDMLKWVQFHLSSGRVGSRQVVSQSTMRELHAPQMLFNSASSEPAKWIWDTVGEVAPSIQTRPGYYAMGWESHSYRDLSFVSHTGGIFGFYAFAGFIPEKNVGFVVLMNSLGSGGRNALPYALSFQITDELLQLPRRDWNRVLRELRDSQAQKEQQHESRLLAARLQGTHTSLPLARYVGTYEEPLIGSMVVRLKNGSLELLMDSPGAFSGELEHWHNDTFRLHWAGRVGQKTFVQFNVDPEGRVSSMNAEEIGVFSRRQEHE